MLGMIGMRVYRTKVTLVVLSILVLAGASAVLTMMCFVGARGVFKRLVISPIPQSVSDIRVDRCQISTAQDWLEGYQEKAIVLRFNVSKDDLSRIVKARGFKPWIPLEANRPWCQNGSIKCQHPRSQALDWDIDLYGPERQAPIWFDLDSEDWAHCDAYLLGEYEAFNGWADASLLFYSEKLGGAYLVNWIVLKK